MSYIFSITFFQATGMTTLAFVMDKKTGMLDRVLASGTVVCAVIILGSGVQSIISLMQLLGRDLLSLKGHLKSNVLIFLLLCKELLHFKRTPFRCLMSKLINAIFF